LRLILELKQEKGLLGFLCSVTMANVGGQLVVVWESDRAMLYLETMCLFRGWGLLKSGGGSGYCKKIGASGVER
jgi:hypothetical protein